MLTKTGSQKEPVRIKGVRSENALQAISDRARRPAHRASPSPLRGRSNPGALPLAALIKGKFKRRKIMWQQKSRLGVR